MSIWKNVASQVRGLAKHVVQTVAAEPMEVMKDAVGVQLEQGNQTQQNSSDPSQGSQLSDLAKAGFKTEEDFQKYEGLSGEKDTLEMQMLRKQLAQEWGLDKGMQVARMEYEEKERQRKEVKEKEKEQKKEFEFQKKQADDAQVASAQREANPENKAWGAG